MSRVWVQAVVAGAVGFALTFVVVVWYSWSFALTNHVDLDWSATLGAALFFAPVVAACTLFAVGTFPR